MMDPEALDNFLADLAYPPTLALVTFACQSSDPETRNLILKAYALGRVEATITMGEGPLPGMSWAI